MTEKKQPDKAALDAVEEQLNLSEAKTSEPSAPEKKEGKGKTGKGTAQEVTTEPKESFVSKALGSLKGIPSKIDDEKKAKLKKFVSSNVGITVIVIVVFLGLWGIHVLRHHHAESKTEAAGGAWNTPATEQVASPAQASTTTKTVAGKQVVTTTKTTAGFAAPAPQPQLDQVMQKLNDLSLQLKNTNQRLMVISKVLLQKNSSKATQASGNYSILGWRLDQDTNQWVADIEYNGQVKAYYAGQRFGRWIVHSVTANGVKIK